MQPLPARSREFSVVHDELLASLQRGIFQQATEMRRVKRLDRFDPVCSTIGARPPECFLQLENVSWSIKQVPEPSTGMRVAFGIVVLGIRRCIRSGLEVPTDARFSFSATDLAT